MRARYGALVLGGALWLTPLAARANGRFPAANMLVARPNDPSHLVLRATYGILFSSDGGDHWDWSCERAVGYSGNEDPTVTMTASGATLAGMFRGFARTLDDGCSWEKSAAGPDNVIDMALRPSAPDRVYAASSLFDKLNDAGVSLFHSDLLVSDDAGAHWTRRTAIDPSLLVDSIEVAPSDPTRLYVSAIRPRGRDTRAVLLTSTDDGAHFTEHALPFGTTDRGVYIAAVDPKRADRVYLRTNGVDASRVEVTDDAGHTVRTVYEGGTLAGFALSTDGATVYAGGPKDGLLVGSAQELRFTKRADLSIQCLATIGDALWACAPTRSGFVLGVSKDGGATFQPKLTLDGMRGPLRCSSSSANAGCAADWTALRKLVGTTDPQPEAGTTPVAPAPATSTARSCGCNAPGASAEDGVSWAGLLLMALAAARVRRKTA